MKGVAIVILVISEARDIELNHGFLGLTDDSVPQMPINELNDSDRKVWGSDCSGNQVGEKRVLLVLATGIINLLLKIDIPVLP